MSYLFGCAGRAAGAVVDPVGEPERYLEAAAAAGAEYVLHASLGWVTC